MGAEQRLKELGLDLPEIGVPRFSYVPFVRTGNLLFISGQVSSLKGKLGREVNTAQGAEAARETALRLLAVAKQAVGNLDKVRVVKLLGMVNSTPEFEEHPLVINGASDLLLEVLGQKGQHARSAVGMAQLPFSASVEIEAIFEVE